MKIVVSFLVALLAGCATTANYDKMLDSWVGAPELDLSRKWGPPVQTYEAGGRKFIVYTSRRSIHLAGTEPSYTTTFRGNTAHTTQSGGSPATNIPLACKTTFEIHAERISSWRREGNDCKAKASG